ncbi:MAG: hypothetical protein WBL67_02690 [Nitrososphaeraceae archaeon]
MKGFTDQEQARAELVQFLEDERRIRYNTQDNTEPYRQRVRVGEKSLRRAGLWDIPTPEKLTALLLVQ